MLVFFLPWGHFLCALNRSCLGPKVLSELVYAKYNAHLMSTEYMISWSKLALDFRSGFPTYW